MSEVVVLGGDVPPLRMARVTGRQYLLMEEGLADVDTTQASKETDRGKSDQCF